MIFTPGNVLQYIRQDDNHSKSVCDGAMLQEKRVGIKDEKYALPL